jgi:hypothetical protein
MRKRTIFHFQTDPEPRLEQFFFFFLVPSFLFRISESLPFGSLALGKIEAAEMLASKRLKGSDQGNEHFSLGN